MTKKKPDLLIIFAIIILVTGAIVIAYFKYVFDKEMNMPVAINSIDNIYVSDLNGYQIKLIDLVKKDPELYLLLFDMKDCYSCIFDGINDLLTLEKSGKLCIAIAIDDNIDNVRGWSSKNFTASTLFVINRTEFLQYIDSPLTPVLVQLKFGIIKKYRFITP